MKVILRGRAVEMSSALRVLRRASGSGRGGVIVVTGAAGIGKTAVFEAVIDHAVTAGFVPAVSKADESDQVSPGTPLLLALRSGRQPLLSAEALQEAHALLDQPLLLIDRLCTWLEEAAGRSPVLVAVDDFQWADHLSRLALRVLPGRLSGSPIVWMFAARDGSGATAEELSCGFAQGAPVETIRLDRLRQTDLMDMARDWLGSVPGERMQHLLESVGGTPLFAAQILDGIARARAHGDSEEEVPAEFLAGVRRWLVSLRPAAIELVRLAAVLGRPVRFEDAVGLMPQHPPAAVVDLWDKLAASTLLELRGAEAAFRHDLVREAVCTDLSDMTRERLHRQCAVYLFRSGHGALTAAPHALAGGYDEDGVGVAILLKAADELLGTRPAAAGDLVVAALERSSIDRPDYWDLGVRCVEILHRAQRCAQAINVADDLLCKAPPVAVAARIEVAAARALWLAGRSYESVDRINAVLAAGRVSDGLRARLYAARALALTRLEPTADARSKAEEALALALRTQDREALEVSLQALGELTRNAGRHARSLAHFRELRAIAGATYLPAEILAMQLIDRHDEAQLLLDGARNHTDSQVEAVLPSLLHAQVWQHFDLGRLKETEAAATSLVTLGAELGHHVHELDAVAILSMLAMFRGDIAQARGRLTPYVGCTDLDDDVRLPGLVLVRGWLAAVDGDLDKALAILGPSLYEARESRTYWAWWPGWTPEFARLGQAAGDARFAAQAAAIAEEGAARNSGVVSFEGIALHVRALVHGDQHLLRKAAEVLEGSPRPALRANVTEDLGRSLLGSGRIEEGIAQLETAWRLFDSMGNSSRAHAVRRTLREAGVRGPKPAAGRSRSTSGWDSLTKMEWEVARLIGSGLTNRGVAGALGLSLNTISTHARSVFAKISVRSRVQLANALHQRDAGLSDPPSAGSPSAVRTTGSPRVGAGPVRAASAISSDRRVSGAGARKAAGSLSSDEAR
ncbi:AAA family ATPase [Streptomyces mirabilis]|uniref:AAA family ATPase n=1 Tax=Streptomyces mirabilis TaxID=68239 RepID=UPI00332E9C05